MRKTKKQKLMAIYARLYAHFGPRKWWPAETAFEVMVGAILTQNTSWSNVEKAILNLRKENFLSVRKINGAAPKTLAGLIKPSGFYNDKSRKLKAFSKFLIESCNGNIKKLGRLNARNLRKKLLEVKGIGPETADSILLYALDKPIFVVDAYTKRIFSRHALISDCATYEDVQKFFTDNIPKSEKLFNEYHALIVETGKRYCRKSNPRCEACPLSAVEKVAKRGKNVV